MPKLPTTNLWIGFVCFLILAGIFVFAGVMNQSDAAKFISEGTKYTATVSKKEIETKDKIRLPDEKTYYVYVKYQSKHEGIDGTGLLKVSEAAYNKTNVGDQVEVYGLKRYGDEDLMLAEQANTTSNESMPAILVISGVFVALALLCGGVALKRTLTAKGAI
jgi:hypothetical protein